MKDRVDYIKVGLIAGGMMLAFILVLSLVLGQFFYCAPCGEWDVLCKAGETFCKMVTDYYKIVLFATGFLLLMLVAAAVFYQVFGADISKKLAIGLAVVCLMLLFVCLVAADLALNIVSMIPGVGPVVESMSEGVLEAVKTGIATLLAAGNLFFILRGKGK